jgi:hypothetical protein
MESSLAAAAWRQLRVRDVEDSQLAVAASEMESKPGEPKNGGEVAAAAPAMRGGEAYG